MTTVKRFMIGGGGALMPVLISILAIDIGAYLDDSSLSKANIIGISIRYLVLFIIGGVIAYLHEDETSSFKLFELGIAGPALLTSLITAQGVVTDTRQEVAFSLLDHVSIINSAHAAGGTNNSRESNKSDNAFLDDLIKGISGAAYRDKSRQSKLPSVTDKSFDGKASQSTKSVEKQ